MHFFLLFYIYRLLNSLKLLNFEFCGWPAACFDLNLLILWKLIFVDILILKNYFHGFGKNHKNLIRYYISITLMPSSKKNCLKRSLKIETLNSKTFLCTLHTMKVSALKVIITQIYMHV